ncbi:GH92 family glycosyl hydrolase [Litoribacter alkaliphilus]|uniref:GH92 family glycosyl hydrolase n=2 Tax=Litoribacter ruber TaxID=702568 RepID=A0AAP2CJ09_9BACT|nr:GH92 family glycosyl hydrolase [Litoribacter alkaliphilus]
MDIIRSIVVLLTLALAVSCSQDIGTNDPQAKTDLIKYVNPLIGTAPLTDPEFIGYTPPPGWRVWAGLTYPGTSLPNAMVQLSPITEYGSGSGYQYEDTVIYGFTHTNKGHWNLCNIPVLPISGETPGDGAYGSRYSHQTETAQAGFYEVFLEDYKVRASLTSTLRSGYHQYRYEEPTGRKILFDLAKANNEVSDWKIEKAADNAVQGFQRNGDQIIHFYALLNEDIRELDVKQEGDKNGSAILHLQNGDNDLVEMKIGLSFVSSKNAKLNLEEEIGHKTFDEIRAEAGQIWENLLSKIQVEGGSEKQKEMFYSSLYRSFLWPALRSDINGDFSDINGEVANKGFNYYTRPSFWDTYRNKLVLLSIISPEVTGDIIKSLQDMGEKTGFIPTFFHGDHAAPFIAGAYKRGIRDYDVQKVYQLLLRNANEEGGIRPHIEEYIQNGYISTPEIENPHVETKAKAGVSKTLEYAYDDYSLAQLAKDLNDTSNYQVLMQRSKNYKNVFDTSTNFMRGRLKNGEWVKNFDPQYPYYEYMFREANAWQLSFFAPHDMQGLIALYGGESDFEAKLDSLFTVPWNPDHIARNVSSFIGQYCVGNQPDHEAPFSYHFIGKPEKSQEVIDNVLNNFYGVGEHGLALPGMDDAGEMSAWYVFGALGLYPFSPADDEYIVTVPLFDQVRWKVDNGNELIINKPKESRNMVLIEVNQEENQGYFISHDLFRNGGEINIMTD